jgi:hypothetical protein
MKAPHPYSSQEVSDQLKDYLNTDEDLWLKDFSLTLDMTWEDFYDTYVDDEDVGYWIKIGLQMQESKLIKGGLQRAYDKNVALRILEHMHKWDKGGFFAEDDMMDRLFAATLDRSKEVLESDRSVKPEGIDE